MQQRLARWHGQDMSSFEELAKEFPKQVQYYLRWKSFKSNSLTDGVDEDALDTDELADELEAFSAQDEASPESSIDSRFSVRSMASDMDRMGSQFHSRNELDLRINVLKAWTRYCMIVLHCKYGPVKCKFQIEHDIIEFQVSTSQFSAKAISRLVGYRVWIEGHHGVPRLYCL